MSRPKIYITPPPDTKPVAHGYRAITGFLSGLAFDFVFVWTSSGLRWVAFGAALIMFTYAWHHLDAYMDERKAQRES